ncbi:membrane hypothetical protein [Verrucomicrobia bacterium]|nr:membrane hypothetical protein [Verrucomicrobiota bacterium]
MNDAEFTFLGILGAIVALVVGVVFLFAWAVDLKYPGQKRPFPVFGSASIIVPCIGGVICCVRTKWPPPLGGDAGLGYAFGTGIWLLLSLGIGALLSLITLVRRERLWPLALVGILVSCCIYKVAASAPTHP